MRHISLLGPDADPFDEHPAYELGLDVDVLGGRYRFTSNTQALLELVRTAYGGLAAHDLGGLRRDFQVRLRLVTANHPIGEPPPLQLCSGGGMYGGVMDAHNFAFICPAQCSGLVSISDGMLEHAYHARYELIEFAAYALAARVQSLISMHCACIGRRGRGILLIGESGAGKSTLALHCLSLGMQLVSEDSVFVVPDSLLATGVGTFLHLRAADPLRLQDPIFVALRNASGTIRRRSGISKHELDLRRYPQFISDAPLQVSAIVFLMKEPATDADPLMPLSIDETRKRLNATQAYAAGRPGWSEFVTHAVRVPAYELRRMRDPHAGAQLIATLLEGQTDMARTAGKPS